MADKKVLVVVGATGKQGGSVIDAILKDKKAASQFSIRGLTRDPSKPAAQDLAERGVNCVKANLNDQASVGEALKGAYAVYAVTDFWETGEFETEVRQGMNIADAAKANGVQHLVWSSLINVTQVSGGKLSKVSHFDSKATVEEYIRKLGIPATFFLPGVYMSNMPGQALNNMTGVYTLSLPVPNDTPIPLFDTVRDTGKFVKAILLRRDQVLGKRIYGATAYYTPEQMINDFRDAKPQSGQDSAAVQVSDESFKDMMGNNGLSEKGQEEMLQNMQLLYMFGYYGGASLEDSIALLDEPPTSWRTFVEHEPLWSNIQ